MPFSFFGLLGRREPQGLIKLYGLEDWWLRDFEEAERDRIHARYKPLGGAANALTEGVISCSSQSSVGFLHNLAGYFCAHEDRTIALKILAKADELAGQASVLDRHLLCQAKIDAHYRDRKVQGELEKAIQACQEQILLASEASLAFAEAYEGSPLPGHKGYQQLAIIYEKQHRFDDAISLCRQAERQGWAGDWQHRIRRVELRRDRAK